MNPRESITEALEIDFPGDCIEKIIVIAWAQNHYAILEFDLVNQLIHVYNGLRKDPETNWRQFKKSVLLRIDEVAELDDDLLNEVDNFWPMHIVDSIGDVVLIQEDSYNCGPIACMVYIQSWRRNTNMERKHNN